MSNFENPKAGDLLSVGVEIGHKLERHDWLDASAALSECANHLSLQDLGKLARIADLNNSDAGGITFEPVYAYQKVPKLDPVTNIASSGLVRSFVGIEAGLSTPNGDFRSLISEPAQLGPKVLELGNIYDQLNSQGRV